MGIRILIGDPDRDLLTVFESYLSSKGFQVVGTDDEQQCLRQVGEFGPDVLLLELDHARRWGERVVAALRRRDSPNVPVIALTRGGRRAAESLPDGLIRAYLVKPFPMAQLVDCIHEVVGSLA